MAAEMSDDPIRSGPFRVKLWEPEAYKDLDEGIRFAVKVLHAAGIETGQSCQGGPGHSYPEPTIEWSAGPEDASGFAALHALTQYGLPVSVLALRWHVLHGLPYEKLWCITFFKTMEARADEMPVFIVGYSTDKGS